jgi:hypothetical protein
MSLASDTMIFAVYPAAMFVTGLAAALIAPKRGRDGVWWGIFCFLFPPLILVLLMLPPGRNWRSRNALDDAPRDDDHFY